MYNFFLLLLKTFNLYIDHMCGLSVEIRSIKIARDMVRPNNFVRKI